MNMNRFWRKWHRVISLFIAAPFALTLITGLIMTTRGFNSWVQTGYEGPKVELKISFEKILEACQSVPEAEIKTWKDLSQIDIRPSSGLIRARSAKNIWEVQINGETGEVIGAAPRRLGLLTALHEGAYFGSWVRYGIFVPAFLGVLFLLVSGLFIYAKTKK